MTEIFKAGEHIKIVRTDPGYALELGDQTGLVGTVTSGTSGGSVNVTFPHTGDKEFYYLSNEIARAYGTTPLPEPLKIGDWVKVVNHTTLWDGTVGKIDKFYDETEVQVSNDKHPRGLGFSVENLELTEKPAPPAPKYAVGDWVQVDGYSDLSYNNWEGVKGKVMMVGEYDHAESYSYVIEPHDRKPYSSGGFAEKFLKPTTQPIISKFKVGDWVEITGWGGSYNGEVLQVKAVPTMLSGYYKFEGKDSSYGFGEKYLKAAEAPHWTDTKPVGAVAQLISSAAYGSRADRVVVKTATDTWLHLYQNDGGNVGAATPRSSENTKLLLRGYGEERFKWSNDN